MKFKIAYSAVLACVVLAACSQRPAEDTGTEKGPQDEKVQPAVAAVATEGVTQNGPYELKVNPGQVFRCAGRDRAVAKVSWAVTDPEVKDWVEVYATAPGEGQTKTLFAKGGLQGDAETGNWVLEGTRFDLVNPADGKELASYVVTALPCE